MTTPIAKAAHKPRTCPPARPNYTLAPAAVPVGAPTFFARTSGALGGIDYTVALYSDDSVRIVMDNAPVALGRCVTSTAPTPLGYSVSADIVDVSPVDAVSADVLRSLTHDLTFFAARAGRFAGVRS